MIQGTYISLFFPHDYVGSPLLPLTGGGISIRGSWGQRFPFSHVGPMTRDPVDDPLVHCIYDSEGRRDCRCRRCRRRSEDELLAIGYL